MDIQACSRYWEQKGGTFLEAQRVQSGTVVQTTWPLCVMVWWCLRTFRQGTSSHLEKAPGAFLARSPCRREWRQRCDCLPLPPFFSPCTSLDLNHWSCGAPRCWLLKHQLPWMCLFMLARCCAAHQPSPRCTQHYTCWEAAPVTAEVTFSTAWQGKMEGAAMTVTGNIRDMNTPRE